MRHTTVGERLGTDEGGMPRGAWIGNAVWITGLAASSVVDGAGWFWIGVVGLGVSLTVASVVAADE